MGKRRGRGEGSIEQLPDGRWRAVLSQGINAATGKRCRRKLYGKTKAEALAKLRAAQAAGATPDGKATLGEWLDRWLTQKQGQVQPASLAWYEARIRRAGLATGRRPTLPPARNSPPHFRPHPR